MRVLAATCLTIVALSSPPPSARAEDSLRVCADPNNLPFSDANGAGFENKLAELVAKELGKPLSYTWWAQRRGFIRNTLKAGACDLVMGLPTNVDAIETTVRYYRSAYVFVSRADRGLDVASLADQRLGALRIGVHLIGDDGMNTPPAHVLGARGMVSNVVGYSIYGDYREPSPALRPIQAVESADLDIAAVWGPFAGYQARRASAPLHIEMITGTDDYAPLQFAFDISMGVRKGDDELKRRLRRCRRSTRTCLHCKRCGGASGFACGDLGVSG